MRILILLLFITLSALSAQGQTIVKSFEAAEQQSIDILEIEEGYGDALNSNPEYCVFEGRQTDFIDSYRKLISDISSHLVSNGFLFDGDTRMFTRIYFDTDGFIEHYYYSSKQAGFSLEQEEQFNSLLEPFLSSYKFNQKADKPYAQCSPVVFAAPTGK
ncbi:hypothetical protein [Rhodohalobacter sp.]|uniref:hypothetical protein n=1 Tax=Rhodohalobacter sp. TaxID=1974210 RepID=UPI002ACE88E0|nr:hypothetical protein [Rhodohalobacter sp.]MDZ7756902.1 hypothetical protein [Rhodohalobacter sp.]